MSVSISVPKVRRVRLFGVPKKKKKKSRAPQKSKGIPLSHSQLPGSYGWGKSQIIAGERAAGESRKGGGGLVVWWRQTSLPTMDGQELDRFGASTNTNALGNKEN